MRVAHVSADFPDPVKATKTTVIRSHIELTSDLFDHHVISLNRRPSGMLPLVGQALSRGWRSLPEVEVSAFPYGEALTYDAPGKGVFHRTMLVRLGDCLAERLSSGPAPDLLVGHKLSIEGFVVHRAAQRLGIPYAISIQGNTDCKIVQWRPDLRRQLARIYHEACYVFAFAPWAKRKIDDVLGIRSSKFAFLPCPTDIDLVQTPVPDGDSLVSVFHLWNHRQKNLAGMARAARQLVAEGLPVCLEVIGGGTDAVRAECERVVAGNDAVRLAGALGHAQLPQRLNAAKGFVLPSHRESFGLVFIEALFAGLPIIYPAEAAVDGYLDGLPFAIRVDSGDRQAIAEAMRQIWTNENALKDQLADWQQSKEARRFQRKQIGEVFAAGLRVAAGQ